MLCSTHVYYKQAKVMNLQTMLLALPIYAAFEAFFRIGVLISLVGWRHVNWKVARPHLSMLVSPGYWLAKNCKLLNPAKLKGVALRARLIVNYNLWNLLLSAIVLVATIATQSQGYVLFGITNSLIVWRAISRSFEIAIAFGNDITTPKNASGLRNEVRMKLAIKSYFEIFLYSAALYSVSSQQFQGLSQSLLASLYVGTFTDVPAVAKALPFPHLVFLQVFATLSLVVLSIAGYLSRVKQKE